MVLPITIHETMTFCRGFYIKIAAFSVYYGMAELLRGGRLCILGLQAGPRRTSVGGGIGVCYCFIYCKQFARMAFPELSDACIF